MAAAGLAVPAALGIIMELRGVRSTVTQIRETAGEFDLLRGFAQRANDAIDEIRTNQFFTGGAAAQVAALGSAFETAGIAAGRLAVVAREFRERLFRDPIAIGGFGRSVLPARLGGPQDETAVLREAIQMLRETRNAEERLYLERKLGLEALDPLIRLDKKHFDAMMAQGQARGAQLDDELQQLRAIEDSQRQRIQDLRDEEALKIQRNELKFRNWIRDNIILPWQEWIYHGRIGMPPAATAGRAAGGMDAHTQALNNNTRALANLSENLANAGPRGRRAIPGAYDVGRGQNLQEALQTGKLQIGAFIP